MISLSTIHNWFNYIEFVIGDIHMHTGMLVPDPPVALPSRTESSSRYASIKAVSSPSVQLADLGFLDWEKDGRWLHTELTVIQGLGRRHVGQCRLQLHDVFMAAALLRACIATVFEKGPYAADKLSNVSDSAELAENAKQHANSRNYSAELSLELSWAQKTALHPRP